MTEKSLPWAGIVTGDCGPYSDSDWVLVNQVLAACSFSEGVAPNYILGSYLSGSGGGLYCYHSGLNNITVDKGAALIDGKVYRADATVPIVIPSAVGVGNTRIDRIVLRANWAAQTVRVYRIAGTDAGSPVAPAIVQTHGVIYDLKLCQVLVNTGGQCTETDERSIASILALRQGGAASGWGTGGTANMSVGLSSIQVGAVVTAGGVGAAVTFPKEFMYAPVVFPAINTGASGHHHVPIVTSISSSGCHLYAWDIDTAAYLDNETIMWIAVGPYWLA